MANLTLPVACAIIIVSLIALKPVPVYSVSSCLMFDFQNTTEETVECEAPQNLGCLVASIGVVGATATKLDIPSGNYGLGCWNASIETPRRPQETDLKQSPLLVLADHIKTCSTDSCNPSPPSAIGAKRRTKPIRSSSNDLRKLPPLALVGVIIFHGLFPLLLSV